MRETRSKSGLPSRLRSKVRWVDSPEHWRKSLTPVGQVMAAKKSSWVSPRHNVPEAGQGACPSSTAAERGAVESRGELESRAARERPELVAGGGAEEAVGPGPSFDSRSARALAWRCTARRSSQLPSCSCHSTNEE